SGRPTTILEEMILHSVPAVSAWKVLCPLQDWQLRLRESTLPMISESAIQIPGHDKPFFRFGIISHQMIFVEAVPMLHQRGSDEVVDIFVEVHAFTEEGERIFCFRKIMAE